MACVTRWLALLTALLAIEQAAAATDCDNDGKVVLAKGSKNSEAIVYGVSCNETTLTVDSKSKLTASGFKIEEIKSIPDVVDLNLALNSLSAIPKFADAEALTKLTLTSNKFTSFKDLNVPANLKTLDLSWNSIESFSDMSLPSTLTDLYVGGNKFTSLSGSFPNTLKLLYVHDLPLQASLSDATLSDSIAFLSLVNSGLTTLDSDKLPKNLTSLDVSKNSLTVLPAQYPEPLLTLIGSGNKLTELSNIIFPRTMTTLNLSSNAITKVSGVLFPWSLTTLDLGSATITQIELCRSDFTTFSRLKAFSASIEVSSSCSNGAEKMTFGSTTVCVLSDDAFNALYNSSVSSSSSGSAGPSASTSGTASDKDGSSSLSVVLIIVICVAAVLAIALAVVGTRTYRAKMNKQQMFVDTGFFANNTQLGSTGHGTGNGIGYAHGMNNNGSGNGDMSGTGYNFNTIFTGGKVTMMGGTAVESSLIKYRIPSNDIKIGKAIAKGGFGVVHIANYNNDQVVVKKILPEKASDDRCLAAFLDEIKLCSTLTHDKIVRFIGVSWNTLSDMAVVMEFMPNGDLEQLLKRQFQRKNAHPEEFDWYQNSATLPSKAALALDIMEAIVYLHSFSSPIIHRDLKAKNVLLGPSYEAKLSDFGISREWQVDTTMTAGIGTMAWIAPEVLRGERYTEMADIYSLGVVLSELATCNKPFEGVTNALIVLKVTSEEKPDLGPDCPEDIRELALRCLSYNASDRPSAMVAHYEMRTLLKLHTAFEL